MTDELAEDARDLIQMPDRLRGISIFRGVLYQREQILDSIAGRSGGLHLEALCRCATEFARITGALFMTMAATLHRWCDKHSACSGFFSARIRLSRDSVKYLSVVSIARFRRRHRMRCYTAIFVRGDEKVHRGKDPALAVFGSRGMPVVAQQLCEVLIYVGGFDQAPRAVCAFSKLIHLPKSVVRCAAAQRKKATHKGVAKAKAMRAEGPAPGVSAGAGTSGRQSAHRYRSAS